jgi:hypothetical protein
VAQRVVGSDGVKSEGVRPQCEHKLICVDMCRFVD